MANPLFEPAWSEAHPFLPGFPGGLPGWSDCYDAEYSPTAEDGHIECGRPAGDPVHDVDAARLRREYAHAATTTPPLGLEDTDVLARR